MTSPSERLLILHVSDLHIGNPKHGSDPEAVLRPLLTDLKGMRATFGRPPDLIVFTGDLAFGHDPPEAPVPLSEQLKRASNWLTDIATSAGCTENARWLLVPGNHDVDRSKVGRGERSFREMLRDGRISEDELFEYVRKETREWKQVRERLATWAEFAREFQQGGTVDPITLMTSQSWYSGDHRIVAVGLNTAWASHGNNEDGHLWIGRYQLEGALELLSNDGVVSLVASHHPVGWLVERERTRVEQRLCTRFHLHLYGHEHSQWVRADQGGHVAVAAGAAYQGSTKENGYSWLEVDLAQCTVTTYLRRYDDSGTGGWSAREVKGLSDRQGRVESKIRECVGRGSSSPVRHEEARPLVEGESLGTAATEIPIRGGTVSPPNAGVRGISHNGSTFVELLDLMQDRFAFRWAPPSIPNRSTNCIVYWPVRERGATAIHAAQAFAAALLARNGANVQLWLDDLGDQEAGHGDLTSRVDAWIARIEPGLALPAPKRFSEFLGSKAADPWGVVQKWFAQSPSQYSVGRLLRVSKVLSERDEAPLDVLSRRRPRKLLTPPVIWLGLKSVIDSAPKGTTIFTLGGADEIELWRAWREYSMSTEGHPVGHLYAPLLTEREKTVRMESDRGHIKWETRDEIVEQLQADAATAGSEWYSPLRLCGWSLTTCVLLPEFASAGRLEVPFLDGQVSRPEDLGRFRPEEAIRHLGATIAAWYLGRNRLSR